MGKSRIYSTTSRRLYDYDDYLFPADPEEPKMYFGEGKYVYETSVPKYINAPEYVLVESDHWELISTNYYGDWVFWTWKLVI